MKTQTNTETHVSILAPSDGTALLFQGYCKQALFLKRENVSRFIDNPNAAGMLVIPPYAALALHCFVATETVSSIQLKQDLAISGNYTLTIRFQNGSGIRYYSSHEDLECSRSLREKSIRLAITPKLVAKVDDYDVSLAVIGTLPQPQKPDYAGRFAHETVFLVHALLRALHAKQHSLIL